MPLLRTRSRALATATALALVLPAAPSYAEPVPPESRVAVVGWSEGAKGGSTVNVFGLTLSGAPEGTEVTATMTSCGRPLVVGVATARPRGGFAHFTLLEDNENLPTQYPSPDDRRVGRVAPRLTLGDLVGPSYEYTLRVTEPGRDPYDVVGSRRVQSVRRPACAEVDAAVRRTVRVLTWSTLRGTPRVRRVVRATPPVVQGPATVSYTWRAGTRVVGRSSALRLRRGMRGKAVSVQVQIAQAGRTTTRLDLFFPRLVR